MKGFDVLLNKWNMTGSNKSSLDLCAARCSVLAVNSSDPGCFGRPDSEAVVELVASILIFSDLWRSKIACARWLTGSAACALPDVLSECIPPTSPSDWDWLSRLPPAFLNADVLFDLLLRVEGMIDQSVICWAESDGCWRHLIFCDQSSDEVMVSTISSLGIRLCPFSLSAFNLKLSGDDGQSRFIVADLNHQNNCLYPSASSAFKWVINLYRHKVCTVCMCFQ